jgi:hypothetical protein
MFIRPCLAVAEKLADHALAGTIGHDAGSAFGVAIAIATVPNPKAILDARRFNPLRLYS